MLRLLALTIVLAAGCPTTSPVPATPAPAPPTKPGVPPPLALSTGAVVVEVPAGERRFKVELAIKDQERQRGLMYREHLADDAGMLFLFERMQPLAFWMKNTWIPLDMVFIDDDLRIVGIVESAEPLTTTSRRVPGLSRYVLELRGGLASELGLAAGQQVRFEGVPAALYAKAAAPGPPR